MELPDLGKQCSSPNCQQLDFLPLQCSCKLYFCQHHYFDHGLNCDQLKKYFSISSSKSTTYKCSDQNCKDVSLLALCCLKCNQHYCTLHRYHSPCYDLTPLNNSKKLDLEQVQKVYDSIDQKVNQQLAKALKKPAAKNTANKVILMRLRGRASGETNIPTVDRVYFQIYHQKGILPIYVSKTWSLGRCIDSIAKFSGLKNSNNLQTEPKLRLFGKENKGIVGSVLSDKLVDLINLGVLFDGQDLVIDYCNESMEPINSQMFL